jgi:hypothetical protein
MSFADWIGWPAVEALGSALGGLGTTGAVIVSLYLVLNRDKADRARAEKERQEAQARLVTLAIDEWLGDPQDGGPIAIVTTLKATNMSTQTISKVRFYARLEDARGGRFQEVEDIKTAPITIGPNDSADADQTGRIPWDPDVRGPSKRNLTAAVVFEDADGRIWTRWNSSRLVSGDEIPDFPLDA